jgi:hypothetical protein
MSPMMKRGAGILYMKVGTHANEPLDEIFKRKMKEIEQAGVAFWGYGGSTCHPTRAVQPFAKAYEERDGTIHLCMHPMDSKHFALTEAAEQFSTDGMNWEPIPSGIKVTGSRYALVVNNLRKQKFTLPLENTVVALGNRRGSLGSKYIRGRVDKACLELSTDCLLQESDAPEISRIELVADLVPPYAVHVRNGTK